MRVEEGSDDCGEVVVMGFRGGATDGTGVLEGAVECMEGCVLVKLGLMLGRVLSEMGFVCVHVGIGGDRVVRVSLVEVVEKGVRGVFAPLRFRLGLDLGDPSVDGVKFGGKGLYRAQNGGKGRVKGGGRFRSEGPFPSIIHGR